MIETILVRSLVDLVRYILHSPLRALLVKMMSPTISGDMILKLFFSAHDCIFSVKKVSYRS